jgi:hypothetical protein
LGTKELWRSPERVTILAELTLILINGDFLLIADSEFAVMEQPPYSARGFDLNTIICEKTAMMDR